jgi:hypothetical protein
VHGEYEYGPYGVLNLFAGFDTRSVVTYGRLDDDASVDQVRKAPGNQVDVLMMPICFQDATILSTVSPVS